MDQKMKFIIIGLVGFSAICLFLFFQATSQQQVLLRETTDLKAENATLLNKINQLENDLKQNQGRTESLRAERDKVTQELRDLQGKFDQLSKARDELIREKNDNLAIQDSFKTAKSENDALNLKLKDLNSRKEVLDKKVQSLEEEKSTMEKRLNEMEAMFADKAALIDSLKNELDAVKSSKPEAALEKKGESVVELPAIVVRSTSPSAGKILAVNTESNFVVINLGISSGVKVGDEFNVLRSGKSIGSIVVIQARDNISACDIKKVSTALKADDNIG